MQRSANLAWVAPQLGRSLGGDVVAHHADQQRRTVASGCNDSEHILGIARVPVSAGIVALFARARCRWRQWPSASATFAGVIPRRPPNERCRGTVALRVTAPELSTSTFTAADQQRVPKGKLGGLGIVNSLSDLPKTEALGIEIRASAALAAPVSVLDGSFLEDPIRVRHELGEDPEANLELVCSTLRQILNRFTWKGAVGCSITTEVSKKLGCEDFAKMERTIGSLFLKNLRGKVSFCHTVVHTNAAAYNELVWGDSANEALWRGQLVLLCTLGKHIGAVLFNDGHRVRNSPLNTLLNSAWQQSLEENPDWMIAGKFTPPEPGCAGFAKWAAIVDGCISEIVENNPYIDRIILMPTGRTARHNGLPEALLPLMPRTCEAAMRKGGQTALQEFGSRVSVRAQREGSVVSGVALATLIELEMVQVLRSLESVLNGDQALHSLSDAQLRTIFDKIDANATNEIDAVELREVLLLLGIERDLDSLVSALDTSNDRSISFEEFRDWWRKEVSYANVVLITSADAWKRILDKKPPQGFGELIVLEVAFTFCRSCRSFEKKFQRLAAEHKEVRFVQLMGNSSIGAMDLCTTELEVKASPAFFIFRRGGEMLARWTGTNLQKFQEELTRCMQGG